MVEEETYLNIFLSPVETSYDFKKIIMSKLKKRYLFKEVDARMITNIELNNLKRMPLSKSTINSVELNIPVKIDYKTYKK